MTRTHRSVRRHRRALLVDLENVLRDERGDFVVSSVAADLLVRILAQAGPVDYALAVAPRACVARYAPELAAAGLRWTCCRPGPDAADRDLCLVGLDLVERGFTQIVVSSGDHFFECLDDFADLTVVVPRGARVSYRLWRKAEVLAA